MGEDEREGLPDKYEELSTKWEELGESFGNLPTCTASRILKESYHKRSFFSFEINVYDYENIPQQFFRTPSPKTNISMVFYYLLSFYFSFVGILLLTYSLFYFMGNAVLSQRSVNSLEQYILANLIIILHHHELYSLYAIVL